MAVPTRTNLTIYQGATWSEAFTVRDAAGVVVNLTGKQARFTILREIKGEVLITLTTEDAEITNGGATGILTLNLTFEQTAALPVTEEIEVFPYVLKVINTTPTPDVIDRVYEGVVIVWPDPELADN